MLLFRLCASVIAGTFLMLHSPDGGRVAINPDAVATLREPAGGGRFPTHAHCVITMSNGGVVAVSETCNEILAMMGRPPI